MLGALAIITASLNVLLAVLLAWGLSEQGRSASSVLAVTFLVSSIATVYAVKQVVDDDATGWLAIAAVPPVAMVALLVSDRSALWGNFPPPAPQRILQRVAAVAVFALPGILAWTAS